MAVGGFYVPATLLWPIPSAEATIAEPVPDARPAVALDWPTDTASAIGAVGFDGVLDSHGTAAPLPIASISKVITALVVLDEHPIADGEQGPSLTFGASDVALWDGYRRDGGKTEPVEAGLELTQRQVLQVTLVASANNYAASLAQWAFGSQAAFVTATREWLRSNGLTETTIVEPTGMSASNTSSVADLLDLGKIALANTTVASIVDDSTVDLPFIGIIHNTNKLLGIANIDGIKTGTLEQAGACLLFSADYIVGGSTVTIVGVVLGAADHDDLDAQLGGLLDGVRAGFHEVAVATAGEPFASYSTPWGDSADAVSQKDVTTVLWADTPVEVSVAAQDAPMDSAGATVGSVRFTMGSTVLRVPLVLNRELNDPGPIWRFLHPGELVG